MKFVEKNFDFNIKFFKKRVKKIKNSSEFFFTINKDQYDIIYIDGSHNNNDVYLDLINAFDSLKKKGIIIADDLLWNLLPEGKNPVNGIHRFINSKKKSIKVILIYNQIIFQKK
jgi:predicted O-methyltransferase YrrM